MKKLYLFGLLLFIGSCSLNSDQEASLNNAMSSYIDARNDGNLIAYTALTHPNVIAYYKDRGDDSFMNRFDLNEGENSLFLQDGNIRETESSGDNIHVKYEFVGINEMSLETKPERVGIIAISSDDGKSWHFLDEYDYWNDDIIKPNDRLITTRPKRKRSRARRMLRRL